VVIGRRGLKEGEVEVKMRRDGREEKVEIDRVVPALVRLLRELG
jgi:hypothetical protein